MLWYVLFHVFRAIPVQKKTKNKKRHTDNITYLLNRLMKEIKEIQTIFIDFLPKLNMLVIQSHKTYNRDVQFK